MVPVKLDAEKEGKPVADKYRSYFRGYPAILFINREGEVEGKIEGYMPPDSFEPEMRKFVTLHTEFPKAEAKYKSGDRSAATLSKLVWAYAGRNQGEKAEALLPEAEKAAGGKVTVDLAKAYNAVGDYHQMAQRMDQARGYFRKALKTTDPTEITYARISIASCYIGENKPDQAIPELKAIVAMPNATPSYKKIAQQMLQQLQRRQ